MTLKSPISSVEWYFLHEFAEKSTTFSAMSTEKYLLKMIPFFKQNINFKRNTAYYRVFDIS